MLNRFKSIFLFSTVVLFTGCGADFNSLSVPSFEKNNKVNANMVFENKSQLPTVEIKLYSDVKIMPFVKEKIYNTINDGFETYIRSFQSSNSKYTIIVRLNNVVSGYSKSALDDIAFFNLFNVASDRTYTTLADVSLELENEKQQVIKIKNLEVKATCKGSVAFTEDMEKGVRCSVNKFFTKLPEEIERNISRYLAYKINDSSN